MTEKDESVESNWPNVQFNILFIDQALLILAWPAAFVNQIGLSGDESFLGTVRPVMSDLTVERSVMLLVKRKVCVGICL